MAKWSGKKVNASEINNGNEYERKDRVTRQQLNAIVNNSLFASNIAENVAGQLSSLNPNDKIEFKGSNPNLLINGDFRVNQRGQENYSEMNKYTVDRWKKLSGNSDIISQNANGGLDISVGVDATSYNFVTQYIEDDFSQYVGNNFTLSSKSTVTGSGKYCVRVNFYSDEYQTSIGNAVSATFDNNATSLKSITFIIPEGTKKIGVVYRYNSKINGDLIHVLYMKLERGNIATPFSPRPYAEDLALCQRYGKLLSGNSTPSTDKLDYGIPMYANPTITTITIDGTSYKFADAEM